MIKFGILCFLAIVLALASAEGDNYDSYYQNPPTKVVYVEEPEQNYKIIRSEPNYKKTTYEYSEPEQKKVIVKVVKPEARKVYLRPSYEPKNKDVIIKILDKKN